MSREEEIRNEINKLVGEYQGLAFAEQKFKPGETPVHPSGKLVGAEELQNGVRAVLDGWWTEGRFADELEGKLAEYVGVRKALLANSGSSANLLALATLTDEQLAGKRINPGDEVITLAAGFPTTVTPIVQLGAVPVFVDIEPLETGRYNIDPSKLEQALSDRTKAIMIAHTLGNPFDLGAVLDIASRARISLIEDCCDALGSKYGQDRVGSFGDLATLSFYPAHHMTMGEGGAVLTMDPRLAKITKSLRNWGRDCWCNPGQDDTCNKRFGWKNIGTLPDGYDHKNVYTRLGYNMKITDMQAAIGVAQFDRLENFAKKRKENFDALYASLSRYDRDIILPESLPGTEPIWFGFPMSVREGVGFTRDELVAHLTEKKVLTRPIFAGNITRHPCLNGANYKVAGSLENSDATMNRTFWVGVQPNITDEKREYVLEQFDDFFAKRG